MIRSADIHARIGDAWPAILAQLGIDDSFLATKSSRTGPCPACGGKDRFFFDNKRGRGDYFCRQCGAGDGFQLLARVHGWDFSEARRRVMEVAGMRDEGNSDRPVQRAEMRPVAAAFAQPAKAQPPTRVKRLLASTCAPENCADASQYLSSRKLWPLPDACAWRAHAGAEYFAEDEHNRSVLIGRFPALVADVRDIDGELVTAHVTYLNEGRKLEGHEPRKSLSKFEGHEGSAVRLMPLTGRTLGIAEGIETALSALRLIESKHPQMQPLASLGMFPVWAALNTSLLSKFEPPPGVSDLVIFADRDDGGLSAALACAERIQGRIRFRVRTPRPPANDWNDVLTNIGERNER